MFKPIEERLKESTECVKIIKYENCDHYKECKDYVFNKK